MRPRDLLLLLVVACTPPGLTSPRSHESDVRDDDSSESDDDSETSETDESYPVEPPLPPDPPAGDAGSPALPDSDADAGTPPSPPPPPPPPRDTGVGISGLDYPFNDITSFTGLSQEDCWRACLDDTRCAGVAIGTGADSGKCWLKTRFANAEPNAARATFVRSSLALARFQKVTRGIDDQGTTLATLTEDAQGCAQACSANAKCIGFVRRQSANACILKSSFAGGAPDCADCFRYCDASRGTCP